MDWEYIFGDVKRMKFRVILTTLVMVPFLLVEAQAVTKSAEDVIREAITQVTKELIAEKEQLDEHPNRVYDIVKDLIIPHFDFPIISRLALGKTTWRQINEIQKEIFIKEFTILLVRTYARALQEYSDEEIIILATDSDPNSNRVEVKTEVSGNGSGRKTPINYRMHVSGGQWKVWDLVIDGISLVNSYRGEYKSIIRKNGFDGLLSKMMEKNARSSAE